MNPATMLALLLLKRDAPRTGIITFLEQIREAIRRRRVRCPTCGWQPGVTSRWSCVPTEAPEHFPAGCGTSWNTFETGGRCPGCDHQWQWTACLQCQTWAKHGDWYEEDDN